MSILTQTAPTVLHIGRSTIQDTPEAIAAWKARMAALFHKETK